ncbi:serine/threonine transporter SstT [Faecalicatena contorta]|uniref:Serine/threonine transporter SstT n=3 Tax=Clostridia TaxID=186801 RepID=A0ABS2ECN0_9FIRM|nr:MULTISPECIES: serine/threonine transporter SstT [Faecalicatena]MBM6686737.1 serine/threonine transporter SstT [Faecalicatena contorta]MBM6711986.1 serine/threonine transporter SstT [Faecalicatena contorta]MBM6739362.1 serine/threonine transporter SstT [Faecalicatena fissicatena]
MKNAIKKWNSISLVKRIIVGLIIGIILGLVVPQASGISILGDLFVGALRGIAPVLVFFLVMSALCHMGEGQHTNMAAIVVLYMLGNLLAALVAVIAHYIFPVTITFAEGTSTTDIAPPSGVVEVLTNLLMNLVDNPVNAIVNANYIGILAWAIIFGIALKKAGAGTKKALEDISDAVSIAVQWVISCAPFGIMGLIFTTISEQGLGALVDYGRLILVLVGSMAVVAFIINPLVTFVCVRKNPYPLVFTCLKESFITAFFTRSSAANIPVNMELCKNLNLDEDTYSISIPLGSTVNMAGAAITISTMALAAATTLDIQVSFGTALIMCVLAAASAAGASGVAGGSLLLIPLACSLFNIPNDIAMQVVGVGFIIGVIQDSCETGINSSTDVLYTACAEFRDRRLHPERYVGKPEARFTVPKNK